MPISLSRSALAAVLTCALFTVASAATSPSEIQALLKSGKVDDAVAAGRTAVQAAPENPDLRLALAGALAAKGKRLERVVDVNLKAEDVKAGHFTLPKYDSKTPSRLEVGYDAALFEEALLHLSEGIRRAPKRKDLRLNQIYLLTDAARIDRAATALREAVAALPRTPGLAEELEVFGAERTKRGDAEGGAVLLGIVSMAFPSSAQVQADYSFTLARLARKREAFSAMDRAVSASPADLRIRRMSATVGLVLRDFGRARSAYEAAFAISRQDQDRLGSAVAGYGVDRKASVAEFESLASPAPSADPNLVNMANSFAVAAAEEPPGTATKALAKDLVTKQQELLAIPLLDRMLVAQPADPEAVSLLADIYDKLGCGKLASAVKKKGVKS
jgi:tetratricopeptide (TPR) repeat protein